MADRTNPFGGFAEHRSHDRFVKRSLCFREAGELQAIPPLAPVVGLDVIDLRALAAQHVDDIVSQCPLEIWTERTSRPCVLMQQGPGQNLVREKPVDEVLDLETKIETPSQYTH